jgi:hypothetical protein
MTYNLVIVCSAIHTNPNPLDYTPSRSYFTHEQRFNQTLETIDKVREKIPEAYIVLVEVTKLNENYRNVLIHKVDYLHETYDNEEIFFITEGPYKGWGEATSLLSYLTSLHFIELKEKINSVSKISGRYKPNDHFTFEVIPDTVLCRINYTNPHHHSNTHMSTMFYTIDITIIDKFIRSLGNTCLNDEVRRGVALEHILPLCMLKENINLQNKDPLYVEGEYGPWGGYVMH